MVSSNAAIMFEPDGYTVDRPKLMGRHSAGNGFLRAAVAGLRGQTIYGYTPRRSSANVFAQLVTSIDPEAKHAWVGGDRLDMLEKIGALYMPGPNITDAARLRLRAGAGAYSIVGVTHTTATHRATDSITSMLTEPVMPWDALICTSKAVKTHVERLFEAQADYLAWRLGARPETRPQLPVIPLGVHCDDFAIDADERVQARRTLGIADDEVVALFVGRLNFHAKAHPHAMYAGLEAATQQTGKKVVMLQCGWFGTEQVEDAFKQGVTRFCPSVRAMFVDGREAAPRRHAWAAADIFVSLSDNIQETFGLTPIEAMAAGLPVVVTDWDGYKETVADGLDGYRVRTFMPAKGYGNLFARTYESGVHSYDLYTGLTCMLVSVDHEQCARRLADLIADPQLRRRLGDAGREHARAEFDWSQVFKRYAELWSELGQRRVRTNRAAAPPCSPGRLDPFDAFADYPTTRIDARTRVVWADGDGDFNDMAAHPLFIFSRAAMPKGEIVQKLREAAGDASHTIQELSAATGIGINGAVRAIAVLAKMGLVKLGA